MNTTKSLAVVAGLLIGGLNISAKSMDRPQMAKQETAEMKTYVTAVTSDEERQVFSIEQDYVKGIQNAKSTVTGKVLAKTEKELYKSRDLLK